MIDISDFKSILSKKPTILDRFYTFEGTDGVGKTTTVKSCAEMLENYGLTVVTTREPYGFKSNAQHSSEEYYKDRDEHLRDFILPNLEKGHIVLCDRYELSTTVYQNTPYRLLEIPQPAITFVLGCPNKDSSNLDDFHHTLGESDYIRNKVIQFNMLKYEYWGNILKLVGLRVELIPIIRFVAETEPKQSWMHWKNSLICTHILNSMTKEYLL